MFCTVRVVALVVAVLLSSRAASAQIDARMLRYPAVSRTQIAFVYAGDVWLVGKQGGDHFAFAVWCSARLHCLSLGQDAFG